MPGTKPYSFFTENTMDTLATGLDAKKFSDLELPMWRSQFSLVLPRFGFPDPQTFGVCLVTAHGQVWKVVAYTWRFLGPKPSCSKK